MKPEQLSSLSRVVDPRYSSNRLVDRRSDHRCSDGCCRESCRARRGRRAVSLRRLGYSSRGRSPVNWIPTIRLRQQSRCRSHGVLARSGPCVSPRLNRGLARTRMAAGTVGTALRPLDIGGIIVVSGLLGTNMVGAVGVAAMIVGVLVGEPRRARGIGIAVAAAAAFAVVGIVSEMERSWAAPDTTDWIIAAVTIISMLVAIPAPSPTSSTDRRHRDSPSLAGHRGTCRGRAGRSRGLVIVGGGGAAALAATVTAALAGTAIRQLASGLNRANDRGAESRQTVRW